MHMIIYAIVEASAQSQAVERGKNVFDELAGDVIETDAVFGYYQRVIERVTYEVAGCGKCVYDRRNPARCSFSRRVLECRGY
jgi:hypothetical protein